MNNATFCCPSEDYQHFYAEKLASEEKNYLNEEKETLRKHLLKMHLLNDVENDPFTEIRLLRSLVHYVKYGHCQSNQTVNKMKQSLDTMLVYKIDGMAEKESESLSCFDPRHEACSLKAMERTAKIIKNSLLLNNSYESVSVAYLWAMMPGVTTVEYSHIDTDSKPYLPGFKIKEMITKINVKEGCFYSPGDLLYCSKVMFYKEIPKRRDKGSKMVEKSVIESTEYPRHVWWFVYLVKINCYEGMELDAKEQNLVKIVDASINTLSKSINRGSHLFEMVILPDWHNNPRCRVFSKDGPISGHNFFDRYPVIMPMQNYFDLCTALSGPMHAYEESILVAFRMLFQVYKMTGKVSVMQRMLSDSKNSNNTFFIQMLEMPAKASLLIIPQFPLECFYVAPGKTVISYKVSENKHSTSLIEKIVSFPGKHVIVCLYDNVQHLILKQAPTVDDNNIGRVYVFDQMPSIDYIRNQFLCLPLGVYDGQYAHLMLHSIFSKLKRLKDDKSRGDVVINMLTKEFHMFNLPSNVPMLPLALNGSWLVKTATLVGLNLDTKYPINAAQSGLLINLLDCDTLAIVNVRYLIF